MVESLHDVGLHMKPRNGFTKPLDLALVALLQPPVSNKIPGCFFKTRPSTTRRHDKYCILCVSARPLQREIPVSSHASPNRLHEHMIPSQLLDNEVFLGCKRRVASCSLSPVFKHPPNQQGREASATRKNARVLKAMPQGFTKSSSRTGRGFCR